MDNPQTFSETLRLWLGHDAPPLVQFIKYGICGATATAFGIMIFYACASWLWPCLTREDILRKRLRLPVMDEQFEKIRSWRAAWCNTVGFMLSNMVAYITNILLVFTPGRFAWYVEVAFFYAVSGVAFFIGTTGQTVLIKRFKMTTTFAFAANIIASFMINYVMRRFVIFKG